MKNLSEIDPPRQSDKKRIASLISNFGNPFTLLFLFTLYSCFVYLPFERALKIILLILFLALVPTGLFIVFNVKRGKYSNYDVSNQKQRPSLYLFSLVVILFILGGLLINHEPQFIIGGCIAAFSLLLASFMVNMKIKCSLHTSFAVFIAIAFLRLNIYWSLGLFIFSILMGWSRLELHRHTNQEVVIGAILGSTIGVLFYLLTKPYVIS